MVEDQTFFDFYAEFSDIMDSNYNLGENIPKSKVIQKSLRSLSQGGSDPRLLSLKKAKMLNLFMLINW